MDSKKFIQFCDSLNSFILKKFRTLLSQSEAEEEIVISKHLQNLDRDLEEKEIGGEIHLNYPKLFSERNLIKYSILSWYLPSITRFELQEVIRAKALQLHYLKVESYLYSKRMMMFCLFTETDYKQNDIFGNILQEGIFENVKISENKIKIRKNDFIFISYRFRPKCRPKVWKRGYNDHGSLPPMGKEKFLDSQYVETREEQNRIELIRIQEALQRNIRISQLLIRMKE